MRAPVLALALCAPLPALAECPPGGSVFSCRIDGKVLELCRKGDNLTYSYGPAGAPELAMSESLLTVDYQPWPGIGSSVWESVAFTTGDHLYEVWTRTDRNFAGLDGGIMVSRNGASLADLYCNEGTASNPLYDTLFPMKESVGLCWRGPNEGWVTDC